MRTAMILAAGRGKRLRPLTDQIPKSLCWVHGKPLIEHHIINLSQAGFKRIVINHAHLGGQIRQYLGDGKQWNIEIIYSPETPGGLETGGGIVNALPLLGKEPFITVNADIFTDYDFKKLNPPTDSIAHLVLVPKDKKLNHFGDFGLDSKGLVNRKRRDYTFAGIACYKPEFFHGLTIGRYSVTTKLFEWIDKQSVSGEIHSGTWFDIGSQKRLKAANG